MRNAEVNEKDVESAFIWVNCVNEEKMKAKHKIAAKVCPFFIVQIPFCLWN